ncbi:MAG: DUF1254 domain-containing protein [Kofleriaceae bacterium]|nr:DUF1254 domain-containing protein [Kofleriaceae bacterium]
MPTHVSPDNFNRAETDMYFANLVNDGAFGAFEHYRTVMPIERQTVIRANRDTLYSAAVFDLDAGPVTITLPNAGSRFMSLQVIDEDQYAVAVVYGAGSYTLVREKIGTRYVLVAVRTLVDPKDPDDLARVHELQDAITVRQKNHGQFEVPDWDPASRKKVHDALLLLGETLPDSHDMFGPRSKVDPIRHLIGSAMAWGGNPESDALYLNATPAENDGETIHRLVVKDVPVDGFWSISVYNAEGYFEKNPFDAYTINNLTAVPEADGSIVVQFGGEARDPHVNWLPITPGWNYIVRLYRPRAEILDGTFTFPEAQPI